MRVLQVIDQAFRTTTEEQDDAILWLTRCMCGADADVVVLLRGLAVQYAVLTQRQPALELGHWRQTQPADLPRDMSGLLQCGVRVVAMSEDLTNLGLQGAPLYRGVETLAAADLPALYEQVDQVWQW